MGFSCARRQHCSWTILCTHCDTTITPVPVPRCRSLSPPSFQTVSPAVGASAGTTTGTATAGAWEGALWEECSPPSPCCPRSARRRPGNPPWPPPTQQWGREGGGTRHRHRHRHRHGRRTWRGGCGGYRGGAGSRTACWQGSLTTWTRHKEIFTAIRHHRSRHITLLLMKWISLSTQMLTIQTQVWSSVKILLVMAYTTEPIAASPLMNKQSAVLCSQHWRGLLL